VVDFLAIAAPDFQRNVESTYGQRKNDEETIHEAT
jgi:hypothetical protein